MANVVADARALSAGQYTHLVVYGSATIGDGGGGFYVWDASATDADDGADYIKPSSVDAGSPGRWQRVWSAAGGLTAFGQDLIDSADAAAARTTLGLGTAAVLAATAFATAAQGALADTALQPTDVGTIAAQDANSVTITGGSITSINDIAISDGGTGASSAAAAFDNLKQAATTTATGVVELATDGETTSGVVVQGNDSRLHAAVTLAGTPDYLTLIGQEITRAQVDLAADVTGLLPQANLANLDTATETGTSRTNTSADRGNFVRWTNTGAKTFTIASGVAATGDTWQGINAGATGNLTFAVSGVTLTGNLIFAPLKAYTLRFTSSSAADIIGGSAT